VKKKSLPVVRDESLPDFVLAPSVVKGSLRADGTRETLIMADVHGKFTTARYFVFAFLIGLWAVLPWLKVGGNPAIFLDIDKRRFFLFGATFNAQDTWLMFFLLTGVGFGLIYMTALVGRMWCGWACPQTVFLEVYRRVERLIHGPRDVRLRREAHEDESCARTWRKVLMHAVFVVLSVLIAHIILSYFVSMPGLLKMVGHAPSEHPEAFAWAAGVTGILYFNFTFFREQLCLAICPYGRLQSALIDQDSIMIGYDQKRGEPRGKAKDANNGACVDCNRCVVVCPTGIDIRNGLQIDCVACTACMDACNEIMDKLHRPRGLIRYSSTRALEGEKTRWLRPRMVIYTVLLLAGCVAATLAFRKHEDFEANLLRLPGPPYVLDGDTIRDSFEVHIVNKDSRTRTYDLTVESDSPAAVFVLPMPTVEIGELDNKRLPLFITVPRSSYQGDFHVRVHIKPRGDEPEHVVTAQFLGAKGG
jgi:cytochrome c oxidase accessory protein FixG